MDLAGASEIRNFGGIKLHPLFVPPLDIVLLNLNELVGRLSPMNSQQGLIDAGDRNRVAQLAHMANFTVGSNDTVIEHTRHAIWVASGWLDRI